MKSVNVLLAVPLLTFGAYSTADEVPARSALCKSTRTAVLKQADKPLILPDSVLSKKEWDVVTTERVCLKSYGIGYPGGVQGLINASAAEVKADLVHLTGLFIKAKNNKISSMQLSGLIGELTSQKDKENHELSAVNRDTMRIKDIQDGMNREQMLLWGHNIYLRKLYTEGSYTKLLEEVSVLRGQFAMTVAPRAWDEAETHTYFSSQSLKNMIATLELKARAKLAKGNPTSAKAVLQEFVGTRKVLVPTFKHTGGDPTGEIRAPYCAAIVRKG